MARVSRYRQDNLPSAAVGTPGVDNSTGQFANTLQNSAAGVAGAALQSQRLDQALGVQAQNAAMSDFDQEINIMRATERAAEAQLRKARQDDETEKHVLRLSNELDDVSTSLRVNSKYRENPIGIQDDFDQRAARIWKAYAAENGLDKDPVLSTAIRKQFNDTWKAQHKELNNFQLNQWTANMKNDRVNDANELINRAGNVVGDEVEFGKILGKFDAMKDRYLRSEGKRGLVELKKDKGAAAVMFAKSQIEDTPQRVIDLMSSGKFNELIDAKDRGELINKAQSQLRANEAAELNAMKLDEARAKTEVSAIALAATRIPDDPRGLEKARNDLEAIGAKELAKPPELQRRGLIEAVGSKIEQIDSARRQVQADARRARSEAEHTAAINRQTAAIQKAATKEAALANYNSSGALETRTALNAIFTKLHKNNKDGKLPKIQDIVDAQELLETAHSKGYISLPGNQDNEYDTKNGYLQYLIDVTAEKGSKMSWQDKLWQHKMDEAPNVVLMGLNESGDPARTDAINQTFRANFNKGVEKYASARKKPVKDLTDDELEYVRTKTASRMLRGK